MENNNTTNPPIAETPTLSFGQKAVGLTFNPSNDPVVDKIKSLYAEIIDLCNNIVEQEPTYSVKGDPDFKVHSERGQLLQVAIREAQGAQMWAVKGITYKS